MKNKKLAIIHFHPVEFYPPIHNLLNYVGESIETIEIYFFSTNNDKNLPTTKYNLKKDYRQTSIKSNGNRWINLLKIIWFNLSTLFKLILNKPDAIVYYESISSFVPFILSKYIYPTVPIFIHYHEYTTPQQYKEEMKVISLFHSFEPFLYKKALWISHTNHERLKLFQKDFPNLDLTSKLNILPNYPPKKWTNYFQNNTKKTELSVPVKMVYLGSLSTKSMYFKEISEWIVVQNGKFTLDIYSINLKKDVKDFLNILNTPHISIKGSLQYDEIPKVLKHYDIGLILYNGATLNYVYNAPNKLFEYFACGLDVWFSTDLKSSYPYIKETTYPKILKVDFKKMEDFDCEKAINRENKTYEASPYFHENVLKKLTLSITKAIY